MEILVKIDSGHKPKSTNILPKTLEDLKKIKFHYPTLKPDLGIVGVNLRNPPGNFLVPSRFEFPEQSSLLHKRRLRGKFKTRWH